MSEVGDAVELIFTTNTGATVAVDVYDGDGVKVIDAAPVTESATIDGQYPYTFVGSTPGIWRLVFTSSGAAVAVEEYSESFRIVPGPAPFATPGDYIELYGSLSAAREAALRALLRGASQLVRDNFPGIDAQIGAGTVPRGNVKTAVMNMARRVLLNPNGLRSETTGPFSRAYDTSIASGFLELTATDTGLLIPPVGAGRKQKAGTIRAGGGLIPPADPTMYRARSAPW